MSQWLWYFLPHLLIDLPPCIPSCLKQFTFYSLSTCSACLAIVSWWILSSLPFADIFLMLRTTCTQCYIWRVISPVSSNWTCHNWNGEEKRLFFPIVISLWILCFVSCSWVHTLYECDMVADMSQTSLTTWPLLIHVASGTTLVLGSIRLRMQSLPLPITHPCGSVVHKCNISAIPKSFGEFVCGETRIFLIL